MSVVSKVSILILFLFANDVVSVDISGRKRKRREEEDGKPLADKQKNLLQILWPGDWKEQLDSMNSKIAAQNQAIDSKGLSTRGFQQRS